MTVDRIADLHTEITAMLMAQTSIELDQFERGYGAPSLLRSQTYAAEVTALVSSRIAERILSEEIDIQPGKAGAYARSHNTTVRVCARVARSYSGTTER